jgi:hypothetical protein
VIIQIKNGQSGCDRALTVLQALLQLSGTVGKKQCPQIWIHGLKPYDSSPGLPSDCAIAYLSNPLISTRVNGLFPDWGRPREPDWSQLLCSDGEEMVGSQSQGSSASQTQSWVIGVSGERQPLPGAQAVNGFQDDESQCQLLKPIDLAGPAWGLKPGTIPLPLYFPQTHCTRCMLKYWAPHSCERS